MCIWKPATLLTYSSRQHTFLLKDRNLIFLLSYCCPRGSSGPPGPCNQTQAYRPNWETMGRVHTCIFNADLDPAPSCTVYWYVYTYSTVLYILVYYFCWQLQDKHVGYSFCSSWVGYPLYIEIPQCNTMWPCSAPGSFGEMPDSNRERMERYQLATTYSADPTTTSWRNCLDLEKCSTCSTVSTVPVLWIRNFYLDPDPELLFRIRSVSSKKWKNR